MKKIILLTLSAVLFSSFSYGEEINEDELFSEEIIFAKPSNIINNKITKDPGSLSFSGKGTSVITEDNYTEKGDTVSTYVIGNLFVDGRQKLGTKYFLDLETKYDSQSKESLIDIKELFIDFNISNRVYFRSGKQVLQWGRNYLWNPTDLINIEKKSFVRKIGSREGAYGFRVHIPFSTKYNIYAFLDTNSVSTTDEIAFVYKFEFLVKNSEIALAGWTKKSNEQVYSLDFSTRFFNIDTTGELITSEKDNTRKIIQQENILTIGQKDEYWPIKASLGFGKSFDFMDISDRISFHLELYYNQTGYKENLFEDETKYIFNTPVTTTAETGDVTQTNTGQIKEYLLFNNLYEPNNHSQYYGAIFFSFRRFIITDITLNMNVMLNQSDKSAILTSGIEYQNIHNLTLGLDNYFYLGGKNREYTFMDNDYKLQLTISVIF